MGGLRLGTSLRNQELATLEGHKNEVFQLPYSRWRSICLCEQGPMRVWRAARGRTSSRGETGQKMSVARKCSKCGHPAIAGPLSEVPEDDRR